MCVSSADNEVIDRMALTQPGYPTSPADSPSTTTATLSTGAIFGIVAAGVLLLIGLGAVAYRYYYVSQSNSGPSVQLQDDSDSYHVMNDEHTQQDKFVSLAKKA